MVRVHYRPPPLLNTNQSLIKGSGAFSLLFGSGLTPAASGLVFRWARIIRILMGYNPKNGDANGPTRDSVNNSRFSLRMAKEAGGNRGRDMESDGEVRT